jgi:hypothetical protein
MPVLLNLLLLLVLKLLSRTVQSIFGGSVSVSCHTTPGQKPFTQAFSYLGKDVSTFSH